MRHGCLKSGKLTTLETTLTLTAREMIFGLPLDVLNGHRSLQFNLSHPSPSHDSDACQCQCQLSTSAWISYFFDAHCPSLSKTIRLICDASWSASLSPRAKTPSNAVGAARPMPQGHARNIFEPQHAHRLHRLGHLPTHAPMSVGKLQICTRYWLWTCKWDTNLQMTRMLMLMLAKMLDYSSDADVDMDASTTNKKTA